MQPLSTREPTQREKSIISESYLRKPPSKNIRRVTVLENRDLGQAFEIKQRTLSQSEGQTFFDPRKWRKEGDGGEIALREKVNQRLINYVTEYNAKYGAGRHISRAKVLPMFHGTDYKMTTFVIILFLPNLI